MPLDINTVDPDNLVAESSEKNNLRIQDEHNPCPL